MEPDVGDGTFAFVDIHAGSSAAECAVHNRLVAGSNLAGPIKRCKKIFLFVSFLKTELIKKILI